MVPTRWRRHNHHEIRRSEASQVVSAVMVDWQALHVRATLTATDSHSDSSATVMKARLATSSRGRMGPRCTHFHPIARSSRRQAEVTALPHTCKVGQSPGF